MNGPLNPDCSAAKHDACAGDAWDHKADQLTYCTCVCHAQEKAPWPEGAEVVQEYGVRWKTGFLEPVLSKSAAENIQLAAQMPAEIVTRTVVRMPWGLSPEHQPVRPPTPVIVAGNAQQAMNYVREQGWAPHQCVIVTSPDRLRGVRGPVDVRYIGSYYQDRSPEFRDQVEAQLRVIEATS